jgi:hypothetical protein
MKRLMHIWLSLCLAFVLTMPVSAQVSLSSKVDRDRITIGDRILYSVTISRSPEIEIMTPGLAANLGQFEIKDYQIHDPEEIDGLIVELLEYSITTFDTGSYVIPPLPIGYLNADSNAQFLSTEPIPIFVESVTSSDAEDIKDIKGPVEIPVDTRRIILWSLAALAVLAALGGWYYWRKKRAGEPILPTRTKPVKPAHETALEELETLRRSTLLAEGEVKVYHVELSDILRRYIEARYFVTAVEMTTTDTMLAVSGVDMTEDARSALRKILEDCDLVKFAKHRPEDATSLEATQNGIDWVEMTKVAIYGEIGQMMDEVPVEETDDVPQEEAEAVEKS